MFLRGELSWQNYSTIPEKVENENKLVLQKELRRHHDYLNFINDNLAVCIGGNVCELDR